MSTTILKDERATVNAGMKFAHTLRGGDIILLHGELGAGKTTFVKGIAEGLGVKENITSPTFTLMGIHNVPDEIASSASPSFNDLRLCHIDTYRLKNVDELRAIGAEDYIGDPHTITIIEWPEKILSLLKGKKTRALFFQHTKDGSRSLVVQ